MIATVAGVGLYAPVGTIPVAQVDPARRADVNDDPTDGFDVEAVVAGLERFGGSALERRTVGRCVSDLADSGRYAEDAGIELTPDHVLDQLADAPDGGPADRWNWWIGSLEAAYGGYTAFQVRRFG